jgi:hypothetical protein
MTRPTIRIHNIQTNEVIDREMNDEELVEHEKRMAESLAFKQERAEKETARNAVLTKLGLTADEVAALLG